MQTGGGSWRVLVCEPCSPKSGRPWDAGAAAWPCADPGCAPALSSRAHVQPWVPLTLCPAAGHHGVCVGACSVIRHPLRSQDAAEWARSRTQVRGISLIASTPSQFILPTGDLVLDCYRTAWESEGAWKSTSAQGQAEGHEKQWRATCNARLTPRLLSSRSLDASSTSARTCAQHRPRV